MQCDYGKFILKQLDFSPSFSTRDSHLGCASLTICSYNTRARSLIVAVAPTGKASFVYSYVQTRLMGQYNGKWPISLVYVLKPLITAIRAIVIGLLKIYFVPFWRLRAICIQWTVGTFQHMGRKQNLNDKKKRYFSAVNRWVRFVLAGL